MALKSSAPAEARARHQQALAIAIDIASPLEQGRALEGIGLCHLQDGQPGERTAAKRPAADAGHVVRQRGVHASAPVFAGTRIRVSTVQDYLRHGFDADAILRAFPDLGAADIDEARRQLAVAG